MPKSSIQLFTLKGYPYNYFIFIMALKREKLFLKPSTSNPQAMNSWNSTDGLPVFCETWPTIQLLKEVGVFIFVKLFFSKWKGIDIQKSIMELFSLKGYRSFSSFFWLWKMKYCSKTTHLQPPRVDTKLMSCQCNSFCENWSTVTILLWKRWLFHFWFTQDC